MAVLLIISTICGILLGFHFRVLVLVPAMLLATAVITVTSFTHGLGLGTIALTVLGATALLQIGYVAGCVVRAAYLPTLTTLRYRLLRSKPALN
jgi:hypothetical protein